MNDGHVLGVVLAAEDLVVSDEAGVLVGQQQVADRTSDRQGAPLTPFFTSQTSKLVL